MNFDLILGRIQSKKKFLQAKIDSISLTAFSLKNYHLSLLREDLLFAEVSGNKFRKLKYNLIQTKKSGCQQLITFGGAYSNHIAATAAAGKKFGLKTVGVIRGAELATRIFENPTLSFAKSQGMQLHFVSREAYRNKTNVNFLEQLKYDVGDGYILPEGGTNTLAVQGCEEILGPHTEPFDIICVPVGTGGTLAGIAKSASAHQKVVGFSALKGDFQKKEPELQSVLSEIEITDTYCFGGYAKIDSDLVRFMNDFYDTTGILLDPVYTAKMMFGIFDKIKRQSWKKNSRILAVHTGGRQGIAGMNQLLKRKNLPQINV